MEHFSITRNGLHCTFFCGASQLLLGKYNVRQSMNHVCVIYDSLCFIFSHFSFIINKQFHSSNEILMYSPLASISFIILFKGMKACDVLVVDTFASFFHLCHA
jgi:hypothetical protein